MSPTKEPKVKLKRREKRQLRGRMGNFLMFLPNMVRLLGSLLKDARVPTAEKALFVAAIVYVISPIDLIPDVFPFIGQVDDIYVDRSYAASPGKSHRRTHRARALVGRRRHRSSR